MPLHPRALLSILQARLSRWPVTVLTGARQTGKTTLVRDLLPASEGGAPVYHSLDDPDERLRLAVDPIRRLAHGTRLVILDEVQKLPVLLDAVKVIADRKAGHRFLLLGSAQVLLLRQVRETLAGRATLLDLWPLALVERVQGDTVPASGLDVAWQEGEGAVQHLAVRSLDVDTARHWRQQAEEHLRWGGYPALEPLPESDRPLWLRGFRQTYLERDLADLGRVADLDQFALSQNLLAVRTAQLLSYSEVARELGVAVNTVKRYVRFLELSYQGYLLRPLLPRITARLVKSPKFYWTDVGLSRLLAERPSLDDGPLFETAILGEIVRWLSWQAEPPALHFFRVHGGREIDFVLHAADRCLLLEMNAGAGMRSADVRALAEAVESIRIPGLRPKARRLGLMVTRGREVERLAPHVWAVPYWRLFGPSG